MQINNNHALSRMKHEAFLRDAEAARLMKRDDKGARPKAPSPGLLARVFQAVRRAISPDAGHVG